MRAAANLSSAMSGTSFPLTETRRKQPGDSGKLAWHLMGLDSSSLLFLTF